MRELVYQVPRALTESEIAQLVEDYAQAAANAIEAGFDGVEIHGANGYLIDQFLHHASNLRTDNYGGSPENMSRFALEVVDAINARIGGDRVGLRLSPGAYVHLEGDARDRAVFDHLLAELNQRNLAYVHLGIFDDSLTFDYLDGAPPTTCAPATRVIWWGWATTAPRPQPRPSRPTASTSSPSVARLSPTGLPRQSETGRRPGSLCRHHAGRAGLTLAGTLPDQGWDPRPRAGFNVWAPPGPFVSARYARRFHDPRQRNKKLLVTTSWLYWLFMTTK